MTTKTATLIIIAAACVLLGSFVNQDKTESAVKTATKYLTSERGVAWVTIADNELYIGIDNRDGMTETLANAAVRSSWATGSITMIYAADAKTEPRDWTPRNSRYCIGWAIARDGELVDASWRHE